MTKKSCNCNDCSCGKSEDQAKEILAQNTKCFGAYDEKDTVCKTCILNLDCQGAYYDKLSELANEGKTPESNETIIKYPLTEEQLKVCHRILFDDLGTEKDPIVITCNVCGKTLIPKDKTVYVPSGQPIEHEGAEYAGWWHEDCFPFELPEGIEE